MRVIGHIDMDSFFASIEQRENPQYSGLGIVVGADPAKGTGRGVVSTANYQARKYGIHSAMPISTAWRLSQNAQKRGEPKTVFLPVNMGFYQIVSERIMDIIHQYVQIVEQSSIDEAYLDIGFTGNFDEAEKLVRKIKEEIKKQERLTAKVGIGPNKLIAKIASAKLLPDGLMVIIPDNIEKFLDPLPIGDIPGIGPKTEDFFHRKKIYKVTQLKTITKDQLQDWMGKHGADFWEKIRGIDESELSTEHESKSISEQETFEEDTFSAAFILGELDKLATRVIERMKNENIKEFKTVTIIVRFSDFTTKSRTHTLKDFTSRVEVLKLKSMKMMLSFLDKRENPRLQKIRLIGVGIEGFEREEKKSTKDEPHKEEDTQSVLF